MIIIMLTIIIIMITITLLTWRLGIVAFVVYEAILTVALILVGLPMPGRFQNEVGETDDI